MKGLILSGGSGTRLRPITHTGPKQLIPIANKPVLLYCIEDLKKAGITNIGIILGLNMPDQVKAAIGDGSKFGVKITYIEQGEPKGLAHAVAVAEYFLGDEPFVMYLGDNVLKQGICEMVDKFNKKKPDASILLSHVKNPQQFGVAEIKNNKVVNLIEKPEVPKTDLALVGVYLFTKPVFDAIRNIKPSGRGELEITDAIQELINTNYAVDYHIVNGWWKDTGKPEDILEANRVFLDEIKGFNNGTIEDEDDDGNCAKIHGRVEIGEGTIIKDNSVIKGPVSIGKNCEIVNAYIGPYTSVGDNTKIIGGEIEDSILIGDCVINCGKKIVDSLIGKGSKILSKDKEIPAGDRFVVGENSNIKI